MHIGVMLFCVVTASIGGQQKFELVKTQKHGNLFFFRPLPGCICGRQERAVEGLLGV